MELHVQKDGVGQYFPDQKVPHHRHRVGETELIQVSDISSSYLGSYPPPSLLPGVPVGSGSGENDEAGSGGGAAPVMPLTARSVGGPSPSRSSTHGIALPGPSGTELVRHL